MDGVGAPAAATLPVTATPASTGAVTAAPPTATEPVAVAAEAAAAAAAAAEGEADAAAPLPLAHDDGAGEDDSSDPDDDGDEDSDADADAHAGAAGGGTRLDAADSASVMTEEVVVQLPSARGATAAATALGADAELRPRLVTKSLRVDGCTLTVLFRATDARALRQSVGSFREHVALVVEAIKAFEPR
ncbi:hypothetical protein MMPV_007578 [Pyropia vietnamensis]